MALHRVQLKYVINSITALPKYDTPQFLVYGCAFGYRIPYAKVVQRLQYIYNYLKEKLGDKIVNVNAVELMEIVRHHYGERMDWLPLTATIGAMGIAMYAYQKMKG